jgi:diguanylate cyclase (GGDEF)-like protein
MRANMKPQATVYDRLRARWHGGMPLRATMMLVIVLGVTAPALLLLAVEQQLSEKLQRTQLDRAELALMGIASVSMADPIWVVDRAALDAVAGHLLETPQVMAIRVEERLSVAPTLERVRNGYSGSLDPAVTQLTQRTQPIVRGGETLGALTVWFDPLYGQGQLQQRRNQMLFLVAAQVMASLLLLTPVFITRIWRPIERLKAQASALLAPTHGTKATAFEWTRRDELGLLGRHLTRVQHQLSNLLKELGTKNEQLEKLAMYDHLTTLPNRALFTDLVRREMLHARHQQQRFGLFFIDLDRFKAVNDSMGHAAGDALLVEISRRLQETLRDVDVVCRQSGDEFLVLARDIAQCEFLGEMAQRILKAVEMPVALEHGSARVSGSIGIAVFPDDADDFETLVKNADIAMYQAKALGRARYNFFHAELNDRLAANALLEKELGEAIAGGQLVLHYQPQIDARTGVLVGVEALVRWQHPSRGLLYPGSFISLAEESGKIAEMGVWTLTEGCRQKAAWNAQGVQVGCMSVNVSALEFRDHRLIDTVQAALKASGIQPSELEIEITESVLMTETDTSQRIIEHLRALGVGIAIDDFGTGYSSLSYLKRLRPNQLKIDQSFVSDVTADNDSQAIIKGIVGLANALNLTVVAEGVETPHQQEFLRQTGCDVLQGYYIARPLPVPQLEAWVAAGIPRLNAPT